MFFSCLPLPGEMIQFDLRIFFRWVGEKPPTRLVSYNLMGHLKGVNVHPLGRGESLGSSGRGQLQQTNSRVEVTGGRNLKKKRKISFA